VVMRKRTAYSLVVELKCVVMYFCFGFIKYKRRIVTLFAIDLIQIHTEKTIPKTYKHT